MDYYNDIDPFCCEWLRNLIAAGELPEGVVDARPIQQVKGSELGQYRRVHLFAGIGGWALALELAGWPDVPVWTGSCPCQPFSVAGKRKGTEDSRHLWPEMFRLIAECRPPVVAGEQVASKDGREWLAGVRADLETLGYACGAGDLCAAGIGAPHIRQRLYWVAESECSEQGSRDGQERKTGERRSGPAINSSAVGLAESPRSGRDESIGYSTAKGNELDAEGSVKTGRVVITEHGRHHELTGKAEPGSDRSDYGLPEQGGARDRGLVFPDVQGSQQRNEPPEAPGHRSTAESTSGVGESCGQGLEVGQRTADRSGTVREQRTASPSSSPWDGAILIPCRDGKYRRVEPGIPPLAHGIPTKLGPLLTRLEGMGRSSIKAARSNRVGRLKGYGNAIVPELAAEFIKAYLEVRSITPEGFARAFFAANR